MSSLAPPSRPAIHFAWLIRLRWAAIAAQAVTVLVVARGMHVALPLGPLGAIIATALVSNLACVVLQKRPIREIHLAAVMAADVVFLSALLFFSGGPFNPFSFLYLVQIALAAVVLSERWTWGLVGLSLLCSAFLFVEHQPLELPARTHDEHMRWHLWGMWVAFAVAAAFIVYFLMRVLRSLTAQEAELAAARVRMERQERLASLATLAGGAAHELATPLSTIATVARELQRRLAGAPAEVGEDLELLRSQVARCRAILDQMLAQAGESAGEDHATTTPAELVNAALADLPSAPRVVVDLGASGERATLLPPRALAQAVRVLVANAQDASSDGSPVELSARADERELVIEVRDRGAGMPAEVLRRVGEPFFTTKPPGRGMGLGLYLSRAVVERLGGELKLESTPGKGTRATLRVPAATNRRMAPEPA